MSVKDRYDNNIRRGGRVRDLREDSRQEGRVVGTYDKQAVVEWDDGKEEIVRAVDLAVTGRAMR